VRRALILMLGALFLFGVGAMAGLGLASQTAPRKLRAAVEASLSEALGTPVTVASARLWVLPRANLLLLPAITVEANGVEAWPGSKGASFSATRLEAALDLAGLLSGRLRFSSVTLDGARLELTRRSDGEWHPPLLTPGFENPQHVLGRLFAARLPAPNIEVRSGELSVVDLGVQRAAGGPARFEVESLALRLLGPGLLESGRLVVSGTLLQTKGTPSPFELEAIRTGSALPRLELAVSGLVVDRFLPYLRTLDPDLALGGRAWGVLSVEDLGGGGTELGIDLAVSDLRASTGEAEGTDSPLRVTELGLEGTLRITRDSLALSAANLRADDLKLSLSGSLGRPSDADAVLAMEARLPEIEIESLRRMVAWLPAETRAAFEERSRALESGTFTDVVLDAQAPLGEWQAAFEPDGRLLPKGARLATRVEDLTLHPEGDEPVTILRGTASLEGDDSLVVTGLEGRLGERALPLLDLRLDGIRNLLASTSVPVPTAPPLPGRPALQEILAGGPDEGDGFSAFEVEADWILHPVFFRPLRNLKARFEPTPDGVAVHLAGASWGGLPIRGEGVLERSPERVRISIDVGPEAEAVSPIANTESWAHGRFSIETPARPGFHVASLRGGFDLASTRLTVFDATATLGMPGRLTGDARLELGREGEVPANLRLSLEEADAPSLLGALSDDPTEASGVVDLSARLTGSLRPGQRFLVGMDGDARITARDGELTVDLPLLLAVAKASDTFNPFRSAHGIRYDRIEAELRLEHGLISTKRSISIESPDLRLVLSGTLDLRQTPSRLEAVVGCFFFKPLDQVIGAIPVVSRILLGPDRSLFGTYFELTGSWDDPSAGLIPMKTVALGPASFLLEDVPSFVLQGIEAIQSVILGGSPPAVAAPAESADPMGDGS
jgi:hypothetical protein